MKHVALTLLFLGLPAAATAGPSAPDWQLEFPVSVTSGTYHRATAAGSTRLDAIWASAGVELAARRGPWQAALFADRWFSRERPIDGTIISGAKVSLDAGRADWLAVVMNNRPRNGADTWNWAGRMRYRVAPRHKFGVEMFGDPGRPDRTRLSLGYWGRITTDLSATLVYGADIHDLHDRSARIEFSWRIN